MKHKLKFKISFLKLSLISLLFFAGGCSGQEQQQGDENLEASDEIENINNGALSNEGMEQNNAEGNEFEDGNEDFAENNENVNNEGNEDFNDEDGNENFDNQEGNNLANQGNENGNFQGEDNMGNNLGDQLANEGGDNLLDQGVGENELVADGDLALNSEMGEEGALAEGEQAVTDEVAPAFTATPGDRGTVRYATSHIDVRNQPDGNIVGGMERGDHNLVWEDGEWLRTSRGTYVPSMGMSLRAIGRAYAGNNWQ